MVFTNAIALINPDADDNGDNYLGKLTLSSLDIVLVTWRDLFK